jgi:hypothetical protein
VGGEKMMNKRGTTMTTVLLTMIIVMGLFYGMYNFIDTNYESAGIVDSLGYNDSAADIQLRQDELKVNVDEVKDSAQDISEANGNVLSIAWNGLTGLAATITVFFKTIAVSLGLFNALFLPLDFLPPWVNLLANMGILIAVVLIKFIS